VKSLKYIVLTLVAFTFAAMLTGCGKDSTPTGLSLDQTNPAAPAQVSLVREEGSGDAILVWTASASPNVASYEVFRYSPSPDRDNAYVLADQVDAALTSFDLPVCTELTTFHYRVRAVSDNGRFSDWSPVASFALPLSGGGGQDFDEPMKLPNIKP
jgi:hypothetical protein